MLRRRSIFWSKIASTWNTWRASVFRLMNIVTIEGVSTLHVNLDKYAQCELLLLVPELV